MDQVGFVQGREDRDNTIKTLLLMTHARNTKTPLCLLLIDAKKAFDRVGWDFLRLTLTAIGPMVVCRIALPFRMALGKDVPFPQYSMSWAWNT